MARIEAHRNGRKAGWIHIPPNRTFDWTLRLQTAPGESVTVPIRVMTKDRGWTQYYYADLTVLSQYQIDLLTANRQFEPTREQDAA